MNIPYSLIRIANLLLTKQRFQQRAVPLRLLAYQEVPDPVQVSVPLAYIGLLFLSPCYVG